MPTDLHAYAGAGHGFGIPEADKSPAGTWPARFREWLEDRGFLGKRSPKKNGIEAGPICPPCGLLFRDVP